MKVLIACEESQEVCKAFRARGHEAYSCDLIQPSGGHPEWHILGDALKALEGGQVVTMDGVTHDVGKWDLLIAHPPCTYLTNAGARHIWKGGQLQPDRVQMGILARDLFMRFWYANVPRVVIENPVPSKIFCLPEYSQIIQPFQFGHPVTKKTCLWEAREAARNSRKGADKYHDLVTEMLETAIRRVGNEYADMLFEYDQQRREAEKQCEQLAMEGMVKK